MYQLADALFSIFKMKRICMLNKNELEHGKYYNGKCRNANIARWNGDEGVFYHWRTKFESVFIETIKHPEDDDIYDVFIPESICLEPPKEIPFK